jgi:two-component system sensor histidine kinase TtrS
MKRNFFSRYWPAALCFAMLAAAMPAASPVLAAESVKIGVLAWRGPERTMMLWGPTADYLAEKIPERNFVLVPLSFEDVGRAVQAAEVDFILTNTGYFIELESAYGVSRIATLKNLLAGHVVKEFGGVILTGTGRTDLNRLADLRGKTFMGVDRLSFGGWQAALFELNQAGLNPDLDFDVLAFGGTHDAVVYAVRDGRVDAGTVRTDTLERMEKEGRINMGDFKILNPQPTTAGFPFVRSTALYPEWPWARLRHTPDDLAEKVTIALLAMTPDTPAARAARIAGWTVPLDYKPVHTLMEELKIGPYRHLGRVTLTDVFRAYYKFFLGGLALAVVMILFTAYVVRLNRRLERTRSDLDRQLENRIKAEEALNQAYDQLEIRVQKRTGELSEANRRLLDENAERKRVEAELRRRNDYIDGIFQTASALILTLDQDAVVIEINSYAEQITGWKREEAVGRNFPELFIPSADRPAYGSLLIAFFEGRTVQREYENEILRRDGSRRTISWRHSLLSDPQLLKPTVIAIGLDVTERRLAEAQARLRDEQLIQADKMVALGTLVAGVAHEINNPTTSIMMNAPHVEKMWFGLSGVLDREFEDKGDFFVGNWQYSQVRERLPLLLDGILDGARRVKRIVADLKDYARQEGSTGATPVDVNRVVEKALSLLSNLIRKSTKNFQVDYALDLPPVMARSQRLEQVVINLVMNACEALDDDRKGVFVSTAGGGLGEVVLTVRDEGPGIPEENQARVVDPFFTTKRETGGTGLGLAICSRIVNDHAGNLRFESAAGRGTTVIVSLPAVANASPEGV